EPIEPTPIEEPSTDEKSAPRGEIKLFEISTGHYTGNGGATEQRQVIETAKTKLRKEMVTFVIKHCKKQNLKITEDEALAAVDFSYKIANINPRTYASWFYVDAKGLLYMGKLNAWIENNLGKKS
ncbi:MAG: hypothetical protein IKN27_14150, partial [Selenomonadaceae bacterium]|nr:hypothetical protein [Selenomonadaceae bacterium]